MHDCILCHLVTDAIRQHASAELLGAQNVLAAQIGRTVESAQTLLHSVDSWLSDQSDVPEAGDLAGLARHIDRMQLRHEFPVNVRLFNAAGDMIPFGRFTEAGINIADREYVLALADQAPGSIHIGLPIVTRNNATRAVPIAMKAAPNLLGIAIILTAIPVGPLAQTFKDLLVTAPGAVGLIRDDGYILLRNPEIGTSGARIDIPALEAVYGPLGSFGLLDGMVAQTSRMSVVLAYKKLPLQPLYVFASFSIRDLEAKLAIQTRTTITIAAMATVVAFLMAGLIAWLLHRRDREAAQIKEALIQAEEANHAKRDFLANVSHELRTPLNAIIGFSEMVVMQTFGPLQDRYRGYVGDVLTAGRHLLSVVDQLLDMAAIEARRMVLKPELMDPGAVVREIAEMMKPIAAARGVSIHVRPPKEPVVTVNDPHALRQILVNLLGNAVKFCRPGGATEVSWQRAADGVVEIEVADEGEGIQAEDLESIFEPFWRKEGSYIRRQNGTGLGLSLTRQLIERLDGTIAVESQPEQGSRFTVRLPERLGEAKKRAA